MDEQLYKELVQYLTMVTFMEGTSTRWQTHIRKTSTQYICKDNLLYKNTREEIKRVILRDQIEPILYHLHKDMTGAHLGVDAVIGKIKERYYWPQMGEDVKNYIRSCDICQWQRS